MRIYSLCWRELCKAYVKAIGGGEHNFPGRRISMSGEHIILEGLEKGQSSYNIEFRTVLLHEAWQVNRGSP